MHVSRAGLAAFVATLVVATTAHAKGPETYPVSKIRRGQKGYGLTTFEGTKPTRFEFEVIGIMKNFLPKMDIILVRSEDPKLSVSGFWRGMSGSPLFIDGKLACAFSYGFQFNKKAIGGCTPIEYMKREGLKTPLRRVGDEATPRGIGSGAGGAGKATPAGKPTPARKTSSRRNVAPRTVASLAEWLEAAPRGDVASALDKLGPARQPWLMNAPLPAAPSRPGGSDEEHGLLAASVPLALSGFSSPAFDQVKQLMGPYPVEPVQAGGTGTSNAGPTSFALGAAIAVQLIRGDMSANGTGTVSYVDGDGVLAFGHPLFELGELYAPVAAAEIHTVIPSASFAFILASPMRELGTLIQDRKSTIAARTSLKTRMIPVRIRVNERGQEGGGGTFDVEVFQNRFFTGNLAGVVASNAINHFGPDRDNVTAMMVSKVKIKGFPTLQFTDYLSSSAGPGGVIGGARGLRVLVPLLMNPFEPVEIERIDMEITLSYDANWGDIVKITLPTSELRPGKRSHVLVTMRAYDGKDIVEKVPFDVPRRLAGSLVRLEVTAGDQAQLDSAPPQSLADVVASLRKLLPGNVFAVTLYGADEGAAVDGVLVRDLPASALDRIRTASESEEIPTYYPTSRSTSKYGRVINGKQSILVKVADLDD